MLSHFPSFFIFSISFFLFNFLIIFSFSTFVFSFVCFYICIRVFIKKDTRLLSSNHTFELLLVFLLVLLRQIASAYFLLFFFYPNLLSLVDTTLFYSYFRQTTTVSPYNLSFLSTAFLPHYIHSFFFRQTHSHFSAYFLLSMPRTSDWLQSYSHYLFSDP